MDIPQIDVDELEGLLAGGAALFDVREPDEWEAAHVDGASLVPLQTVPDEVERFRGDGSVYVMCAKGGRSGQAVEFLRAQGIDAINVDGGMSAWLEAGKPAIGGT